MIPARRSLALLLAALAALVLAACGSSSDKAPTDAAGILKTTFGPDKPVKSGDLDLSVAFDATGLAGIDGPVKLSLKGPFQGQGGTTLPAFDFDLGLTAGGTSLSAGAISTGKAGFLKFQGTAYALTPAVFTEFKKGYEASSKQAGQKSEGPSFRTLGIDPLRWLSAPKKLGDEEVGGTDSQHVSATVDVPKLLADVDTLLKKAGKLGGAAGSAAAAGVPDGLTTAQRTAIEKAITATSFDVWSGKEDGTLRKLDVKVSFDVPAAAQAQAGGLKKGTVALTLVLGDLNKKQTITAPKSSRPLSELQSAAAQLLSGLTGAAAGGGTSSGGGTGTSTDGGTGTAPTTPQSAYAQCLTAAGTDIAKVTQCAKLKDQ